MEMAIHTNKKVWWKGESMVFKENMKEMLDFTFSKLFLFVEDDGAEKHVGNLQTLHQTKLRLAPGRD